jgi:hypothetical protein
LRRTTLCLTTSTFFFSSVLSPATKHIVDIERRNEEMQARLTALEGEVRRLRTLNEKISLAHGIAPASPASIAMSGSNAATPSGSGATPPAHSTSPPGDGEFPHAALASVSGQDAPQSDSDGSDEM